MTTLLSRNLNREAPTGRVTIDWGHPLAHGLVFAMTGASPIDLVTGEVGRGAGGNPGNSKFGLPTPAGPALVTTGTDTAIKWTAQQVCNLTSAVSVSIGKYRGSSSNAVMVAWGCSGQSLCAYVPWIDGVVNFLVGTTSLTVGSLTIGHDRWTFTNGARGQQIWQNGILRASQATASRSATTDGFAVGNRADPYAPGGETWTAYPYCYVHNRQLSVDEIMWLRVEPYAFLTRGVDRRIFLMQSGPPIVVVSHALVAAAVTASAAASHDTAATAAASAAPATLALSSHDTAVEAVAAAAPNLSGLASHDATVVAQVVAAGGTVVTVTIDRAVTAVVDVAVSTAGRTNRAVDNVAVAAMWREPKVPIWREPRIPIWREPRR